MGSDVLAKRLVSKRIGISKQTQFTPLGYPATDPRPHVTREKIQRG